LLTLLGRGARRETAGRDSGKTKTKLTGKMKTPNIEKDYAAFIAAGGRGTLESFKANRENAARRKRNYFARERYSAMRSLGLGRTPSGWE